MIKSQKLKTAQRLNFRTKVNKTEQNKLNHYKNLSVIKPSSKVMSNEENNFSDSSLELFDTFPPKSKKNIDPDQKSNHQVIIDQIDLTNILYTKTNDFKSKIVKKKCISKPIDDDLSIYSIGSSSDNSFKSTTSNLSDYNKKASDDDNDNQDHAGLNNLHSKIVHSLYSERKKSKLGFNDTNSVSVYKDQHEFQNNYATPKDNHIQKNISESAKILDRIYGNEWRSVDGVIKISKKEKCNDKLFDSFNELCSDSISKNNHNEIENFLSSGDDSKTYTKYRKKRNIQKEINDTSLILENCSLSNNPNDNQLNADYSNEIGHQVNSKTLSQNCTIESNNMKLNNIKKIEKSQTLKMKKKKNETPFNDQSNSGAKLSFLSSLSCFTGSMKCDPEAEKYKIKFKKNKDDLVSVLFNLFNNEVFDNKLPADMNFKWNARLRTTAGACFNKRSVKINENLDCERSSRIELSSKIIDTAERLRDTLIHELCHAACWIFNGISEGHGPSWKNWANKAMQKFPELPVIKRCHSYQVQTKFTYKCIKCGYSFGRHSKSLNLERKRCGYCFGEFELIVNKINNNPIATNNLPDVYTDPLKQLYNLNNDVQHNIKPKLPKKPSKFALFVKENYSKVKQANPLSKHGEIMKILGSQYATTKILTPDEIFDRLLDS